VALYPFLNKVIVPRGVTDLARDQPPADVTLIATKTSLVVRQDLHPALQYLLLDAATEIHSRPSIFNRANEFPAAEAINMPLSQALYPTHSDPGRALPDDTIFAGSL